MEASGRRVRVARERGGHSARATRRGEGSPPSHLPLRSAPRAHPLPRRPAPGPLQAAIREPGSPSTPPEMMRGNCAERRPCHGVVLSFFPFSFSFSPFSQATFRVPILFLFLFQGTPWSKPLWQVDRLPVSNNLLQLLKGPLTTRSTRVSAGDLQLRAARPSDRPISRIRSCRGRKSAGPGRCPGPTGTGPGRGVGCRARARSPVYQSRRPKTPTRSRPRAPVAPPPRPPG